MTDYAKGLLRAAEIADRYWTESNALRDSKVAGEIAKAIRAEASQPECVVVPVDPINYGCSQDGGRCGIGGYCEDCPHVDRTRDYQSREITRKLRAAGEQK